MGLFGRLHPLSHLARILFPQAKSSIKKGYLLFETLIALSLISILLSVLFSFLTQHLRMEMKMEKARALILERQNLQMRLQDLFTSLHRATFLSPLYTQLFPKESKESLVMTFDNGIDPDPLFSGMLLGRIYIDEKKDLCLAIWPIEHPKDRPWRKEVLLSHVYDLSFQFLGERKEADPKIQRVSIHTGWHPSWPKERSDLPSLIRLSVSQNETPLEFSFRLPTVEPIVTYWEGGYKP